MFEQLAHALKFFTELNVLFIFRIFEQLALKFFKSGRSVAPPEPEPPPRTPANFCALLSFAENFAPLA